MESHWRPNPFYQAYMCISHHTKKRLTIGDHHHYFVCRFSSACWSQTRIRHIFSTSTVIAADDHFCFMHQYAWPASCPEVPNDFNTPYTDYYTDISLKSDGIMNITMKQIPVKNNNAWPFVSHLITRWTFPRKVRRTRSEGRCYNSNSLRK